MHLRREGRPSMRPLMTLKEVSERLNCSAKSARRWVLHYMPHVRVGRDIRVEPDALENWIKSQARRPYV
jgi:excisionase family DNA binding protein